MSLVDQITALATRIGQEVKLKAPLTRSISTTNGLQGGGTLAADRTLSPVYGATVNTVCQGNDARLSDARTPTAHTHPATGISDSTSVGRSVVTAADAAAARTAIGAGTSSLALGTTGSTAKAGDYQPTWSQVTSKPTTFAPIIGSTAADAVAGNDARLTDTRTPTDNSVTSAKIVDGAIVNADINASAAIALSKLATGYVQGSKNGTAATLTIWTGTEAEYNTATTNGTAEDSNTIYLRRA